MATLGALKARVAEECDRDDLTTKIASVINRAIEFYASKRFWWNESIDTVTTTANDEYVAIPPTLRREDPCGVFVTVGGSDYPLEKKNRTYIQYWQSAGNTVGQPTEYAIENERLRLFPTPNQAYTITILGVYDVAAPTDDNDSNDWTNYAEDLIAARARFLIARDVTYDNEMMASARTAELEALDRLQGETGRRLTSGTIQPGW